MIRILLADDHPIVREGLRAVLETQADFEVIAEATNGEETLWLALTLQPDIVLLDLEMPVMDGPTLVRTLRERTKWGKVPLLETYRQMAIRQQKAHNYSQALWWAERGIAIYGNGCARPEAVEDLRGRAVKYRAKLAEQPGPDQR